MRDSEIKGSCTGLNKRYKNFCLSLVGIVHILLTDQSRLLAAVTAHQPVVQVIAPASKTPTWELAAATAYINQRLNWHAYFPKEIYGTDLFYANNDEARAQALIKALTGEGTWLWAMRGGYGSARLIPYLERLPEAVKAQIKCGPKKTIIGYSDITALQLYLYQQYGWPALQAAMLSEIVNQKVSPHSVAQLTELITQQPSSRTIPHLTSINLKADQPMAPLTGMVVGGNLTLVEISLGTCWQIDARNNFLFLEDIGLSAVDLERRLDHLRQAKVIDEVKAVIFGEFISTESAKLLTQVKQRFAQQVAVPVFSVAGIGHSYIKTPLPLYTQASLQASEQQVGYFSLTVASPHQGE